MAYNPLNPNGQASMAGSQPVVIASNQSPVSVLATIAGTPSISGTVNIGTIPGSVVAFQGTNPWVMTGSVQGSFSPSGNQSVSGTVGASVIGTVPVVQSGLQITSVVSSIPSSVLVGASIFGQLPAGTAPLGSVATLQGTNPWIITGSVQGAFSPSGNQSVSGTVGASIIGAPPVTQGGTWIASVFGNVSVLGTVPVTQSGTWVPSAMSYLVRNDTLASTLGADGTYGPAMRDSVGRAVIKPFSSEDGTIIRYVGSVVSTSVTLIKASAIGKKNYITDFWISNTGATTTLVTFQGGDTSVVGYGMGPTGAGESSPGIAIPLVTTVSQDLAFKANTATSVLYLTVNGYQAP